ncbi:MAG TPA: sigma-70 family RNA polymerase sigma factor [Balneolales bacterium]|nr:sigma-70 family RNA polymerase sigma factor [Balneolales bacterium]
MYIWIPIEWIILALAVNSSSDLDEVDLYRRIKNGDKEAFKEFYELHHAELYYMLIGKGMSPPSAKDILQQAFIIIWEKRTDIDEHKSLRAYLFRIGYTRALNYFRDNSKFDKSEEMPDEASDDDPSRDTERKILMDAIDSAIQDLPKKRRMVFELCFMQGLTYREAADALGLSIKTIENHMGNALKDMRSALSEFKEY